MDQESVVLGMKTANKELFPPHISILKHLWMSTVMSMMTQLHKHFIWESYWICRWMCINLIPCDVSGAHVVLHPPLIKIFWSVAIQKFLGRLLCCLIPQFLPDSSDALAPAILWTSISQMVRHTTRMIFWWAVFISDLGRERAKQTSSVASISVVAWEWKGGVNLKPLYGKRNKAITIYLSDECTHFTLRIILKFRNRCCIRRCKHCVFFTGVYADSSGGFILCNSFYWFSNWNMWLLLLIKQKPQH